MILWGLGEILTPGDVPPSCTWLTGMEPSEPGGRRVVVMPAALGPQWTCGWSKKKRTSLLHYGHDCGALED